MNNMTGRHLARLVLDQIETKNAYANLALTRIFNDHGAIDQREKDFCSELVYGTLRHLFKIDYILGRLLNRPLDSLKIPVKNTLRIALYQLLQLPEMPERAVVHTAVKEIKDSHFAGLAGLVNGVLRNYLRLRDRLEFPDRDTDLVRYLSFEYSHPQWLVERWLKRFGPATAEMILKANNQQAPLTVRINQYLINLAAFKKELTAEGIRWQPGLFLEEAVMLKELPGSVEELTLFQEGKIFIQDESSMLVSRLLDPHPGETIIDLCAAPGGKSTHLAELTGDRCRIFSVDDHQHKVELIRANAKRLKLNSIEPVLSDARSFIPREDSLVEAVLVDAPCSGTGVLRRRIDARYRRRPEDLAALVELQRQILNHASRLVRPGGRLIYSTCALEPEENQEQIRWFLDAHSDFQIEPYTSYLPSGLAAYLAEPDREWVTLLPIPEGGDGFFICRLKRINS